MLNNAGQDLELHSVRLKLYNGDALVYTLPVYNLNTQFTVGTLPICTVSVFPGNELKNRETFDAYQLCSELSAFIRDNRVSAVVCANIKSLSTQVERVIDIFRGPAYTVQPAQVSGITGSTLTVNISIMHRFAELRRWGSNGYLYGDIGDIKSGISIAELTRRSEIQSQSVSVPVYGGTLPSILTRLLGAPQGGQYSSLNNPIADIIDGLMHELQTHDFIHNPVKSLTVPGQLSVAQFRLSSYMNGSVRTTLNYATGYNMVMDMLKNIANGTKAADIASSIIAAVTVPDVGLTLAPRSLDKMTLIQNNGWLDTGILPIKPYMITGIETSMVATDQLQLPDGILVAGQFTEMFSSDVPSNTVYGWYPAQTLNPDVALKWKQIAAPSWADDTTVLMQGNNTQNLMTSFNNSRQKLCSDYAKMLYGMMAFQNNSSNIRMSLDGLLAYMGLGRTVGIYARDTDSSPALKGMLNSYSFTYRSGDPSSVQVMLGVSHVRSGDFEYGESPIYSNTDHTTMSRFITGAEIPQVVEIQHGRYPY